MRDDSLLLAVLDQASRRMRLQRAAASVVRALLLIHALLIPLLVLREILAIQSGWYLPAIMLSAAAGALFGFVTPLPLREVARRLDARLGLKERLRSALEFRERRDHAMASALIRDASAAAARLDLSAAIPLRPSREVRYLTVVLALALVVLWLPAPSRLSSAPAAPDAATAPNAESGRVSDLDGSDETPGEAQVRLQPQAGEHVKAAYKDTPMAEEPPDFASFLKALDGRLSLLDPPAGLPELQRSDDKDPHRVTVQQMPDQAMGRDANQISGNEDADEAADLETPRRAGDPREPRSGTQEAGTTQPRRQEADEADSERLQGAEPQGSPGATPARPTEARERTKEEPLAQGDWETKRFGGGEQPHDAPGGVLPPWLQGSEDPHFQDAGLGEAEGTGKKSGQPGMGHNPAISGAETARLDVPREQEFRLSGQRQEGEWESYDSNLAGLGARVPSRRPILESSVGYGRMAEEALGKEQVPLAHRARVKRYFSALGSGR